MTAGDGLVTHSVVAQDQPACDEGRMEIAWNNIKISWRNRGKVCCAPGINAQTTTRAVLKLLCPWPCGEQGQPKREGPGSIGDGVTHTPHGTDDVAIGDGLQLEADVIDVRPNRVARLQRHFAIALHLARNFVRRDHARGFID